jgi:hypothetical protein
MARTPNGRNPLSGVWPMPRYYEPDLTVDPNSPFVRDAAAVNDSLRRRLAAAACVAPIVHSTGKRRAGVLGKKYGSPSPMVARQFNHRVAVAT